jgi:hypothetical protein
MAQQHQGDGTSMRSILLWIFAVKNSDNPSFHPSLCVSTACVAVREVHTVVDAVNVNALLQLARGMYREMPIQSTALHFAMKIILCMQNQGCFVNCVPQSSEIRERFWVATGELP